jgi:hypothetical protein
MTFKQYVYIAIAILIFIGGVWAYNQWQDYQLLKQEKAKLEQNAQALQDSIHAYADSLSITAVFVRDLNNALHTEVGKNIALNSKILAYIDSLHSQGNSIIIVKGDSIYIPFKGTKGIADFNGWTLSRPTSDSATWDINITFPKPIDIGTELVQNDDKIWRYKVWSLTPGIKVKGSAILDEKTFAQLQKYEAPKSLHRFMIGVDLGFYAGPEIGFLLKDNWGIIGKYILLHKRDVALENIHLQILWRPF